MSKTIYEVGGGKWLLDILLLAALFLIIIPLLIIILTPIFLTHYIRGLWLYLQVKQRWLPEGKLVLFIYSDNPEWKEYVNTQIKPYIKDKTIFLNWSEKRKWINKTELLEVRLFRHYMSGREWLWEKKNRTGGRDFNHLAIVFSPWYKPQKIEFWPAWKEHEFGRGKRLTQTKHQLLELI